MAYHHVEDVETTAERNLTRAGQKARVYVDAYGIARSDPPPDPSVGGLVTSKHSVWRCGHCRALAVGPQGTPPPNPCGKCHA